MSQFNGYIIPLQTGKRPMQMMFQKSSFKMTYVKEIFTNVLLLPCVGGELNMVITLHDLITFQKFISWQPRLYHKAFGRLFFLICLFLLPVPTHILSLPLSWETF
jgi:hypothetical protein